MKRMNHEGRVLLALALVLSGCAPREKPSVGEAADTTEATEVATRSAVAEKMAQVEKAMSDLGDLEEIFFADWGTYSGNLATLRQSAHVEADSSDVLIHFVSSGDSGWAATATHRALPARDGCALFHGAPPMKPVEPLGPPKADTIVCWTVTTKPWELTVRRGG